jgi:hypothetical protein
MPVLLKSNEYWGRRFGGFSWSVPKGHDRPFGLALFQKKWGNGSQNSATRGRTKSRVRQNNRNPLVRVY